MEEVYAALLLHKLGKQIDEQGVTKVIQATGASVDESRVKNLVSSLKDIDIDKELESAMTITTPIVTALVEKKEEASKEDKREAAAEGLSALFG